MVRSVLSSAELSCQLSTSDQQPHHQRLKVATLPMYYSSGTTLQVAGVHLSLSISRQVAEEEAAQHQQRLLKVSLWAVVRGASSPSSRKEASSGKRFQLGISFLPLTPLQTPPQASNPTSSSSSSGGKTTQHVRQELFIPPSLSRPGSFIPLDLRLQMEKLQLVVEAEVVSMRRYVPWLSKALVAAGKKRLREPEEAIDERKQAKEQKRKGGDGAVVLQVTAVGTASPLV